MTCDRFKPSSLIRSMGSFDGFEAFSSSIDFTTSLAVGLSAAGLWGAAGWARRRQGIPMATRGRMSSLKERGMVEDLRGGSGREGKAANVAVRAAGARDLT